ncbi:hypothetical protein [Bradyrhizobium centrolobii]|uniref:hypothetical protein n=1 Tax=Bradyrhizobium centrolobii TaxID=1505087 RepID=UPI0009ED76B1|nr:hypothetical protein [Bradyrhizobium centrolobii]
MRKIVLGAVAAALIAGPALQAFATQPKHHVRKAAPPSTSEQFRRARNALDRPSHPTWPYSGWSAPAGR